MSKIAIVYWSGTGNTEAMAEYVLKGATESGLSVDKYLADEFKPEMVSKYDAIAFGCPSMGTEQLEEAEFEPMFNSVEKELKGKKIALFGSYGWGNGEWMDSWEDQCKNDGAVLVCDSVICNEEPDDHAAEQCRDLGKSLKK